MARWFPCVAAVALAGVLACGGSPADGDRGFDARSDAPAPDLPVVFDVPHPADPGRDAPPADLPGTPDAPDAQPGDAPPDLAGDAPADAPDADVPDADAPDALPVDVPADGTGPEVRECYLNKDCTDKVQLDGPCERPYCRTAEFVCDKIVLTAGSPCDDLNPCTVGEACDDDGACGGGVNSCECLSDADCAPKDDADLCNGVLGCDLVAVPHACVVRPGSVVTCPASADPCLGKACIPATGDCEDVARNEDQACDDGDPCTVGERCVAGDCQNGTPRTCDDQHSCTADSCVPGQGCLNAPVAGPCDDGNACTVGDSCQAGECVGGTAPNCDDGNPCTDDPCVPALGCIHQDNVLPCEDGDPCTAGDTCSEGGCVPGGAADCDDGIACTDDACVPGNGCTHTWRPGTAEGPRGDASCTGGLDEDCDGLADSQDPDCRLQITGIAPASGPAFVATEVAILGDGFDGGGVARIGGIMAAEVSRTATRLVVRAPDHDVGAVNVTVTSPRATVSSPVNYLYTGSAGTVNWGILQAPATAEVAEGATPATFYVRAYHPGLTGPGNDPSSIRAQACFGPPGTLPWEVPGWDCRDATLNGACAGCGNNAEWMASPAMPGGVYDVFARFSLDGIQWLYADLDGNDRNQYGTNFCSSAQAGHLSVLGVPAAGDVVINEIMWMGTNQGFGSDEGPADEFIELRNLTSRPFLLAGWVISNASAGGADLPIDDAAFPRTTDRIAPGGLLLIARKAKPDTAVAVDAQIVAAGTSGMSLSNTLPKTWTLKTAATGGVTLDTAVATYAATCGENGSQNGAGEDRSMERNVVPGDGTTSAAWHTAECRRGWAGAGVQQDNGHNWGTPGSANCDVAIP